MSHPAPSLSTLHLCCNSEQICVYIPQLRFNCMKTNWYDCSYAHVNMCGNPALRSMLILIIISISRSFTLTNVLAFQRWKGRGGSAAKCYFSKEYDWAKHLFSFARHCCTRTVKNHFCHHCSFSQSKTSKFYTLVTKTNNIIFNWRALKDCITYIYHA
jgi:hypothetical protein